MLGPVVPQVLSTTPEKANAVESADVWWTRLPMTLETKYQRIALVNPGQS